MKWAEFLEPTECLVSSLEFFTRHKSYGQLDRQKAHRLLKQMRPKTTPTTPTKGDERGRDE